ncbi:hypothetical protein IF1G_09055 [Cordyceps javanica]|uniref:Uncharacterized protein n=1 Tax=Cordyceps javanica TaxID=43265 RepID=A0A545UST5_9HYPO|nr:hypothetical protein IF1G_09055 [Cordyceps javanica]
MANWAVLSLSFLSLVGLLAMHLQGLQNGTAHMLMDNISSPNPTLPDTDTMLKTSWTRLSLVDLDFSIMVSVFSTILDYRNVALFLQGNHFFGLWMSVWILVLLDSFGRFPALKSTPLRDRFSFVAWGLVMEFVGVAVGLPAWCAVNLQFSPAHEVLALTPAAQSTEDLGLLSLSFLATTGIPSLLMVMLSPKESRFIFSQQTWIVIRLFHPVLLAIGYMLLRRASQGHHRQKHNLHRATVARHAKMINKVYSVAFWIAAGPHLFTLGILLLNCLVPRLLPAHVATHLSLGKLWPVSSIWQGFFAKVDTVTRGVSVFMTANEVISTMAALIWAWTKNRMAAPKHNLDHLRVGAIRICYCTEQRCK